MIMNTLIKIIITTVIGLIGNLTEIEDSQANIYGVQHEEIELNNIERNELGYCIFNDNSCKMLKNKFES